MRIVIVGPGAIGCLFASILTEAGNDVTLLDRDPKRAQLISQNGIRVEGSGRVKMIAVPITADSVGIGTADCVCICVKSYDTRKAAEHALPVVGPATVVVSLQNGHGNAEQMAGVVKNRRLVCAVTSHGSTHLGTGHISHAGKGITMVAPFIENASGAAGEFAEILGSSGIEAEIVNDVKGMVWSKLIVNAAINPITAVWNVPNGRLMDRPDLHRMAVNAAREGECVARTNHVSLLYSDAVVEVERVCGRTRNNISSMLQDIRRGKKTEIDAITGAIVKEGHRREISLPTNEMLLRKIHEKET